MVRVVLIRHGMTEGNLATARMASRVAKGEVRPEDAHALERDEARAEALAYQTAGDEAVLRARAQAEAELKEMIADIKAETEAAREALEETNAKAEVRVHQYRLPELR